MTEQTDSSSELMLVLGETDNGDVVGLHAADGEVAPALLRPVEEGQPIDQKLIRLSERPESNALFNVETLYDPAEIDDHPRRAGPARVATSAYKSGWERVFGNSNHTDKPN